MRRNVYLSDLLFAIASQYESRGDLSSAQTTWEQAVKQRQLEQVEILDGLLASVRIPTGRYSVRDRKRGKE